MTLNNPKRGIGHLAALVAVCIWGFAFINIAVLLRNFTPVEILFYRFSMATLVLYAIYPRKMKRNTLRQELMFAGTGLIGVTAHFLLQDFAIIHTAPSNVSVIVSTSPVLTGFLLWQFVTKERPSGFFFLGALCAIVGIGVISFAGSQLEFHPLGDLLAFLAGLAWAVYSVMLKKIGSFGQHPIQITRRLFAYGLLFLIPFMFITDFEFGLRRFAEPVNLLPMLYLGILSSAVCFALWNFSLNRLGPVRTVVYLYLLPIVTVVGSVLVLDQVITPLKACGIGLVLLGLVLSNRRKRA